MGSISLDISLTAIMYDKVVEAASTVALGHEMSHEAQVSFEMVSPGKARFLSNSETRFFTSFCSSVRPE